MTYDVFADSARVHWEGHVGAVEPQAVPFFLYPGMGEGKSARRGSWFDVIRSIPNLMVEGDPIVPHRVLNSVLAEGEHDGGMSGGVEWPRHRLTAVEYREVLGAFVSTGLYLDVETPDWVEKRDDFSAWTIVAIVGCSRSAVDAWREALLRAPGGTDFRRVLDGRDEWLRAFDAP